jgi:hypothetical protein
MVGEEDTYPKKGNHINSFPLMVWTCSTYLYTIPINTMSKGGTERATCRCEGRSHEIMKSLPRMIQVDLTIPLDSPCVITTIHMIMGPPTDR